MVQKYILVIADSTDDSYPEELVNILRESGFKVGLYLSNTVDLPRYDTLLPKTMDNVLIVFGSHNAFVEALCSQDKPTIYVLNKGEVNLKLSNFILFDLDDIKINHDKVLRAVRLMLKVS